MANSIEVRVPEEIMDYKESLIAGLSVRQLLCGGIALLCGVPTFLFLKGINEDLATYATMIVVIPAFLVGFIKKDGYNFEVYTKIRLYNFFSKSTRGYETSPQDGFPIETEQYRAVMQKEMRENEETERGEKIVREKAKHKSGKTKGPAKTEYDLVEVTEKSVKRKRKAAFKKLKAAAGGNRAKKRKKEKAA